MLRGLCRCSECGSTLVQAVKGKSLQCHKYSRGQCETSHSITIAKINEAVIAQMKSDVNNDNLEFVAGNIIKNETDNINSILLEKERKKLERIKEAFEAGIDTIEEYKLNKTRIMNRIAELESTVPTPSRDDMIATFKTKLTFVLDTILSNKVSENDKNAMLRELISHITFDRKKMTIQIAYLPPL